MATLSVAAWLSSSGMRTPTPSASLALLASSRRSERISLSASESAVTARPVLLHCSFTAPSSSLSSSFSGTSLGLDISSNVGVSSGRCHRLVVRAGRAALCQTKRNRSRKSLARTHGFRIRMRTTSGRAVLKRRRAKGRKVLCTKSHHSSGKKA